MPLLARLFIKVHVLLYQLSGGKLGGTMRGQRVLILSTRGRKTGAIRHVPLAPLVEGEDIYVIGSMGGAPRNPGWYYNLKANPDVELQLGDQRWKAKAIELPEPEREQVWQRVVATMPGFAAYQKKTDRKIPVVRLARAA
jgi:deazaflavin-dependent oxidoreductase (nitroreductase family)